MDHSDQPLISPAWAQCAEATPLKFLSARCRAHRAASAFLVSPADHGLLQSPIEAAISSTAAVSGRGHVTASCASSWPTARACVQRGGTSVSSSFLGWTQLRQDDELLNSFKAQGFRLQLSGSEHASHDHHGSSGEWSADDVHHHELNPVVVGVASMLIGSVIGAGIVLAAAVAQQPDEEEMFADALAVGEARGSQAFVPFQGTGNRMADEEEAAGSEPVLAVAAERQASASESASAQEEARLKAEQESRSKAKAKQKAEEEARLKVQQDALEESSEPASGAASAASDLYTLGGPSLQLGRNPKAAAAAAEDYTSTLGGPALRLGSNPNTKKEKKQKKQKKHKKEADDGNPLNAMAAFVQDTAAVAVEATQAAAEAVDGATNQLVDMMQAAEEGFQSANEGESEEEESEKEEDAEQDADEAEVPKAEKSY